jgi:hypothetical protein
MFPKGCFTTSSITTIKELNEFCRTFKKDIIVKNGKIKGFVSANFFYFYEE